MGSALSEPLQSEELQILLWDQDRTIRRIQDALEARMFGAIRERFPITQEVPSDQYRRFEQFVVRFQALIEDARTRIGAVFRSPDSHNVTAIAQVVYETMQSVQRDLRGYVQAASAKGNGPILQAMEAATAALDRPLQLTDLGEDKLLETLVALPGDPSLQTATFFAVERRLDPVITATFDASNAPDLWERATAKREEEKEEVPAFRWSWSDEELFGQEKLPCFIRCEHSPQDLWREAETSLIEGFRQWRRQCEGMLQSRYYRVRKGERDLTRDQALDGIERAFMQHIPSYGQLLNKEHSLLWMETLSFQETEIPRRLRTFCQIEDGPEPTFIDDTLRIFFAKLRTGMPVEYPLIALPLVDSIPGGYVTRSIPRVSIGRDIAYSIIRKDALPETTVERIGRTHCSDPNVTNIMHSTREVSHALCRMLTQEMMNIPEKKICDAPSQVVAFWKDFLMRALTAIAEFKMSDVPSALLSEIKNAASFYVARMARRYSFVLPLDLQSIDSDERYEEELRDFYPQPPAPEQAVQEEEEVLEAVSSRPLTKEEMLDEWGATMDRMTVRVCKRGMLIMQNDAVREIDLEDMRKRGVEIIASFCSSGAVGKKRMRSLRKELKDAVRFGEVIGERPKLRKAIQDTMTMCTKELQQMFANIDAYREHTKIAVGSPEAQGAPTLSTEFIRCVFLSAFEEHRAHTSTEEKSLHAQAIADRRVDDAYNRWEISVTSMTDDAFAHGPGRMSLDQCLEILEVLRRESGHQPTLERLVPEYWKICVKQNQAVHDEIERRLRARFASAEPPQSEDRVERLERIPKQKFIGLTSALRQQYTDQMRVQMVAMVRAMGQQTATKIAEHYMQHRTQSQAQLRAIEAQLPDYLTLEECRSCYEQIQRLPKITDGIHVPDAFQHFSDEGRRKFDADIERQLPELFRPSEQTGPKIPRETLWTTLLDYQEAGAPERVTQAKYMALDPGFERTLRWCEQCLRQLYEDLPRHVTRDDCRVFVYSARAAMLPLEEAYPFSPAIRQEYKRSFDRICTCAERSIDALFAQKMPDTPEQQAQGARFEGGDLQGRSFSREEITGAIGDVLDVVTELGQMLFHKQREVFSEQVDLYRQLFLRAVREQCPQRFASDVDFIPLEDVCRVTNDPAERTPPPSRMEHWMMKTFPPRFATAMEQFKQQLPISPRKPLVPGTLTRKQVIRAIGDLQGKLEEQIAQVPGLPKGKTVKSEASTALTAARSLVVLRCPEPLSSPQDLQPLKDAMRRIRPGALAIGNSAFEREISIIVAQEIEALVAELEQHFTNGSDAAPPSSGLPSQGVVAEERDHKKSRSHSRQLPQMGKSQAKERLVVSRDTLTRWWTEVHGEAERRLEVALENTSLSPEHVRRAFLAKILQAPKSSLSSCDDCASFVEEMRELVAQLPLTIEVERTGIPLPTELQAFLSLQITHLEEGLLALPWPAEKAVSAKHRKHRSTSIKKSDASSDSGPPEGKNPKGIAEPTRDLLAIYDIAPDQIAERVAQAAADHMAHAAEQALIAHAGKWSEEEVERAAGELRRSIEASRQRAQTAIAALPVVSLSAEQLAAAAEDALLKATETTKEDPSIAEALKSAIADRRSAINGATGDEGIIEILMEGAGRGQGGFEETVEILKTAQREDRARKHGEEVKQLEQEGTVDVENLGSIIASLAAQARTGANPTEQEAALGELRKLQAFLRTIRGMYPPSPPTT